ncbi:MAG: hypothetical protein IPO22_20130 [Anaerolineales bacterium]|nr:hypothetical protein [Anaerolineales bacterium]
MKKLLALVFVLGFSLSACIPAAFQSSADNPTPISEVALQATAAILSQQTLQSLPTATTAPSNTPVVTTPTNTPTQATPTETQNPILLTLTATLGTGTVTPGTEAAAGTVIPGASTTTGTTSANDTPSNTPNPLTPTTTPHPQFYGTLPPNLPYGNIILTNQAEAEVYISLRCVTANGNVTILEYPVKKAIDVEAPVGKYTYVAWVGGREFTGAFSLSEEKMLKIDFFKNKITVK